MQRTSGPDHEGKCFQCHADETAYRLEVAPYLQLGIHLCIYKTLLIYKDKWLFFNKDYIKDWKTVNDPNVPGTTYIRKVSELFA